MKQTRALNKLSQIDAPIFETQDVAALLDTTPTHASQVMLRLKNQELAFNIKRGLWTLDKNASPFKIGSYIRFPAPAYVSLQSALNHHGIIEQLPGKTFCVTLAATKHVSTPFGEFSTHKVHPKFFFGFETYGPQQALIATAEKALVDFYYLSSTRNKAFKALPELDLTMLDLDKAKAMATQISSKRIMTIVNTKLDSLT